MEFLISHKKIQIMPIVVIVVKRQIIYLLWFLITLQLQILSEVKNLDAESACITFAATLCTLLCTRRQTANATFEGDELFCT